VARETDNFPWGGTATMVPPHPLLPPCWQGPWGPPQGGWDWPQIRAARPFDPPLEGHHWWQVSDKEIVGVQLDDDGRLIHMAHGVFGRYLLEDQPHFGATGYVHWQPLPGNRYQGGDFGYWLLHLDPATGQPDFNYRPTPPPAADADG